ncbi:uncharacterized protein LAESUDRAFT_642514 [Laetiporus sulphureus 93-53]|uniref:Uncharacterized protein n=1 Tax=Laetiporus sulphureus 93-53 TaxID=1314785 RepID=A0A165H8T3_9APHY|nr:uncharacterized protein LAESUDRAFT_642514 [Laetiporus sulphureus 93-53]KZT11402.1 hypothetical protein LAESUDRAFT_642514 [Laetiporus sulphureus 93-53]
MAEAPSLKTGLFLIVSALLLLIFGSYATFFEAFHHQHQTGIWLVDILAQDVYYKYFFILLIPTTSYFVIANWVGWQYYRNS